MKANRFYFYCVSLLLIGLPVIASAQVPDTEEDATESQENVVLNEGDQCITCHMDLDSMPEDFEPYDVHLSVGLTCASCHGGDPLSDDEDIAMSEESGFLGAPSRDEIPAFCAQCHSNPNYMREYRPRMHTDQYDQYKVSVHGTKLMEGDQKVAECASCHTAHAILPASDTRSTVNPFNVPLTCKKCHSDVLYMREYGIRTNQFKEFSESVHGRALLDNSDAGAPACNDCHGNHGALPPDVAFIGQVCGTCHVNNQEFFSKSPMTEVFEREDLHPCIECHGSHEVSDASDKFVGTEDRAVCMNCHDEGDEGYKVAAAIHANLDSLSTALSEAEALQQRVVRVGMDDVDIDYLLRQGRQNLIRARTLVHTFDPERVHEVTSEGVKKMAEAKSLAVLEIEDHSNRRVGFGFASLFLSLLAVGLFLKIREVDRSLPWKKPVPAENSDFDT